MRWLPVGVVVWLLVLVVDVPTHGIGFNRPLPHELLLGIFVRLDDPLAYVVPVGLVLGAVFACGHPLPTPASVVFATVAIGLVVHSSIWPWGPIHSSELSWLAPGVAFGLSIAAALVGVFRPRAVLLDRVGAAVAFTTAVGAAFLVLVTYGCCAESEVDWSGFRMDLAESELGRIEPPDPSRWRPRLLIAADGSAVSKKMRYYDPARSWDDGRDLEKWLATTERRMVPDGSEWLSLHVERNAPLDSVLLVLERARRSSLRVRFAALGEPGRYAEPPFFRPQAELYRIFDLPFPTEGFDSPAADAALSLPPGTRWGEALRRVERELDAGAQTVSLSVWR